MSLFDRDEVIFAEGCWLFWGIPGCCARTGMLPIIPGLPAIIGRTPPNEGEMPICPETPGIIIDVWPNAAGTELRWSGTMDGDGVPNGFGPAAGGGCAILLSVGRCLLLIGMILSNADISTVLAGADDIVACG